MKSLLMIVLVTCAGLCSQLSAQDEADTSLDRLLKEGIDLFDRGQYKQARKRFGEILKKGPGQQDLLRLRQLAGVNKLLDVMERGGKFEKFARALLDTTAATASRPLLPDAKIKSMVDSLINGDAATRRQMFTDLDSKAGERSVPHMLRHLKAGGQKRARAMAALRRLGPQIVLPLIEVLHSGDVSLTEAAATVLGQIADRRAAADLKWLSEKGSGKGASAAAVALTQIAQGSAKTTLGLYISLARGYYQERRWTMVEALDKAQYWAWQGGELKGFRTPPYLFGLFQAERAITRGLALDASSEDAWVMLVSVLYAQYARIEDVLASALSRRGSTFTKRQLNDAKKTRDTLSRHLGLAHASGAKIVYSVLGRALAEGRKDVARMACRGLAKLVPHGSQPGSELLEALNMPDNAVKFQAARALVLIDPKEPIAQATEVMRTLESTIGQSGNRVALVVIANSPVRNQLSYVLRTTGRMEVFQAPTRDEGIKLAGQWPAEDVIILDAHLGGAEDGSVAREMMELIRLNPRMARIPIFGIVKKSDPGKLRGLFEDRVIVLPLKPKVYLPKILRALKRFAGDFKTEAEDAAAEAARTLATIDPARSIFKLSDARKGLIKSLSRVDAVRLPALTALGRLASPEAIGPLNRLVRNSKNKPAVRARAAWALGMIHAKSGLAPSVETLEVLTRGLRDKQPSVQRQCAEALGRTKLNATQRRTLLEQLRLRPSEMRK